MTRKNKKNNTAQIKFQLKTGQLLLLRHAPQGGHRKPLLRETGAIGQSFHEFPGKYFLFRRDNHLIFVSSLWTTGWLE